MVKSSMKDKELMSEVRRARSIPSNSTRLEEQTQKLSEVIESMETLKFGNLNVSAAVVRLIKSSPKVGD